MKNSLLTLLLLSTSLILHGQKAPMEVAGGFQVEIQTSAICEMCKYAIEYDLAFEKGVKTAELDLENKVVTIIYNRKKTDPEKLRTRITMVGYHADGQKRDSTAYENLPFCCKDGAHADDHDD